MKRHFIIIILLLSPLLLACSQGGSQKNYDKTSDMLLRVGELNVNGDKQWALALADSALEMGPADTTRCWLLCEKTVALVDMGKMSEAIGIANEALRLAEDLDDEESMLNLRGSMGIAYRRLGKPDSALIQYQKGIELALQRHNSEYEIYLNNCITVLYSESNRFDEALCYAEKTEKAALLANDTIECLSARANIGGIYMRQMNYSAALKAVLPYWEEVKGIGYNVLTLKFLSVILTSYSSLGNYEAVATYMDYADKVMTGASVNSNGYLGITEIKAQLLGAQGKYKEQLSLIDSLLMLNAVNQAMPMDKMLRMKAQCLAKMGRTEESLSLLQEAYHILDSVKQSDIDKNMSEFSVKYKTMETEMALADSKREAAERANLILWLALVIVLLLVLVIALFYRRRNAAQKSLLREKQSFIDGLESERERIAKELHDGVCNDILAIKLMLNTDTHGAVDYLNTVWQNVRHFSHELMPPSFKNVSLDAAVRSYVWAIGSEGKCEVKVNIDDRFDWSSLPQRVAYELYRIIQEATANAIKYGCHSGHIAISLLVEANVLRMQVSNSISRDNEASGDNQSSGIGIQTIRKRADHIGAKLEETTEGDIHSLILTYNTTTR